MISVQDKVGKVIQAHQEANHQVETPTGTRYVVVLLQREESLPRPDQLTAQQAACISPEDMPRDLQEIFPVTIMVFGIVRGECYPTSS